MALTYEGRTIFIPRLQAWAVQKPAVRLESEGKARLHFRISARLQKYIWQMPSR
jgi:hypothetical protein